VGAHLDALVLANLVAVRGRSQRWTSALVAFLIESDPANRAVLQSYLDDFAPLATGILASAGALLETPGGRATTDITAAVQAAWTALLTPHGLAVPQDAVS
jgi:hypothetical protein